jgi:glutamate synthase (NADPH/NADH) large chain
LRKKFNGQPEHVVNYLFMVANEMRQIMAELGVATVNELIGRADLLKTDAAIAHWKSEGIDLSAILAQPEIPDEFLGSYAIHEQDHQLHKALDNQLIELAEPALQRGESVRAELPIVNTNRVVGAMLSNQVITRVGPQMLPDDTMRFKLNGSAGQSLGCFLAKGVTLEVEGDANDFVGKGLSGGRVIVYPPKNSSFAAEENILLGNVALYGATSGDAYFRGIAAERFCVRNSGARAVVEGVGDHGCEYMTGGRVVILGAIGRNFAAGMSGGIAYIWDPSRQFAANCNAEMVDLDAVETDADLAELRQLIENHLAFTESPVAAAVLADWTNSVGGFVKVMPKDYKRVLQEQAQKVSAG